MNLNKKFTSDFLELEMKKQELEDMLLENLQSPKQQPIPSPVELIPPPSPRSPPQTPPQLSQTYTTGAKPEGDWISRNTFEARKAKWVQKKEALTEEVLRPFCCSITTIVVALAYMMIYPCITD